MNLLQTIERLEKLEKAATTKRKIRRQLKLLSTAKQDKNGCWIWTGRKQVNHNYGLCSLKNRTTTAHRASYRLFVKDDLEKNLFVCHSCDVPLCINPSHLFLGTQKENMEDCKKKGRLNPHNSNKTHCARGHAFTGNNFYWYRNERVCKLCKKLKKRTRNNLDGGSDE